MNREYLESQSLGQVLKKYPFLEEYLIDNQIDIVAEKTLKEIIDEYSIDEVEEKSLDRDNFIENTLNYLEQMAEILGLESNSIDSLTIISGINKSGVKEKFEEFTIRKGEIISIVGPTGSGKSRLLADIEWGADQDTPTKRTILINGEKVDKNENMFSGNKLVAQLSQNMNFIMDLTVYEFLELHAKSRMVENEKEVIEKIFQKGNELTGEKFKLDTPVTSLSGGQSRALMIADTAILSSSPIVLIDEIENAGIDKKKALDLLVTEEKIVLIATHDPILALMADKRVILNHGGIEKIIVRDEEEQKVLGDLIKLDDVYQNIRRRLRAGEILDKI